MNIGFPDPCLTPMGIVTVPIPYPNFAPHAMAVGFSPNVLISMMNAMTMMTKIAMTAGDEGGVAHPMIKLMGGFTMGNPIILVNMVPAIALLSPTNGNNFNNPLGAVLVPAVTNVFYTYAAQPSPAGDPPPRAVDQTMIDELSSAFEPRAGEPAVVGEMTGPGEGLITIRVLSPGVPSRVFSAIRALTAQGMERLTLDLRDNPGGDATAFIALASDFLGRGLEIVTRVDADGDEEVIRSHNPHPLDLPLTVLVNRRTASAAELLAGALAAHGRATVVGGPMYGKHVGQELIIAPSGEATMLSTSFYRLPAPPNPANPASLTENHLCPRLTP